MYTVAIWLKPGRGAAMAEPNAVEKARKLTPPRRTASHVSVVSTPSTCSGSSGSKRPHCKSLHQFFSPARGEAVAALVPQQPVLRVPAQCSAQNDPEEARQEVVAAVDAGS